MFDKISKLFGHEKAGKTPELDGLAIATAALLVQVCKADGDFSDEERAKLLLVLKDHFSLTDELAAEILVRAEKDQADAVSLYGFTHRITSELDQEGRQQIVKLLWRVAFADEHIDNFEDNVLAKVAGLLGVSTRDRVLLKHEVQAEAGT